MRLSRQLGKTLRQPPSDAHLASHQLLVRAGFARRLDGAGFAYLPLGQRAMTRLQALVKRELASLGAQEIWLPVSSGEGSTEELVRLARREVDSYRQLPMVLHQTNTESYPEGRMRAGLFGAGEGLLTRVYALGPADLPITSSVESAVQRVFAACDLAPVWAGVGDAGQRVYVLHPEGDEKLVRCPACGYSSERSWAQTEWPDPPKEQELSPEEIATPGCDTIAGLAEFLDIPAAKTLKMVFCSVKGNVTCAVIRGDRTVDEDKLARLLGTNQYYASLEDELAAIGAVGGYASPIGLDATGVRVVADLSVRSGRNFVSGANRPGYHIQNVNIPRDFQPGVWADLAEVDAGDPCPSCGRPLEVELGFALAQSTTPAPCKPEAEYLDREGRPHPLWLASWRVDLGRMLAAVVEAHHDDYGILWPVACAPYDVHLVALDVRKEAVAAQATELYERLLAGGWTVLYDDREASAGVKFNDADLIGVPLRLTVSKRLVKEGLVEAKWRNSRERLRLGDKGLVAELTQLREP